MRLYKTAWKKAHCANRLPEHANEVLQEIRDRPFGAINETNFQRKTRPDREFEALDMRSKSHAGFRPLLEEKLFEMEAARMTLDPNTLYRKYLTKTTNGLRTTVLYRDWHPDPDSRERAMCSRLMGRGRQDVGGARRME